jgi:hypothetical protein
MPQEPSGVDKPIFLTSEPSSLFYLVQKHRKSTPVSQATPGHATPEITEASRRN